MAEKQESRFDIQLELPGCTKRLRHDSPPEATGKVHVPSPGGNFSVHDPPKDLETMVAATPDVLKAIQADINECSQSIKACKAQMEEVKQTIMCVIDTARSKQKLLDRNEKEIASLRTQLEDSEKHGI